MIDMEYKETFTGKDFIEKIKSNSMELRIDGLHYLFWLAFTSHSINTIQDYMDKQNQTIQDMQLQLLEEIKGNVLNCFDEVDQAVEGKMSYSDFYQTHLSFQEVVILHDQLEMFFDTLQLNHKVVMSQIAHEYLLQFKKVITEKEDLYKLTVHYMLVNERGI